MNPSLVSRSLWLSVFITVVLSSNLVSCQSCSAGYTLCSPPGATGSSTYDIGNGLLRLYASILDTVNPQAPAPGASPQPVDPNGPAKRQSGTTMCCATGLSCMLLLNADVPMCYDKFTTDYALPNGDYGTVSNGTLVTSLGVRVDLISGNYTVANGQTGNIYSSATSDKPNTATLPIPTQDTSSGVGSAVPANQLGSSASYAAPPTVTITASSSSILSLSGPAVTPCSTCCNECERPSTTVVNASTPTITSMPSGSGTANFPSYMTGVGNATITPPITVGAGARPKTFFTFSTLSVASFTAMLLVLVPDWVVPVLDLVI